MKGSEILLPMFFLQLISTGIEYLVQQHIASIASLHHFIRRRSVARDHNLAVASLELVPISFLPYSMLNRKRRDRNVLVAINHSRLDFMNIHPVPGGVSLLQSAPANSHIFRPCLFDVRSHALQPVRTISLQRFFPSQHPWRTNQVWITQRVVRMQMGYKNNVQFFGLQGSNTIFFFRSRGPVFCRV